MKIIDKGMRRTAALLLACWLPVALAAPAAELWERWSAHDAQSQLRIDHAGNTRADAAPDERVFFSGLLPSTGQPFETGAGPSLYSESDAIEQLLRLPVVAVGVGTSVCRLVQHPKHGLDVYPSTLFFVGPRELMVQALSMSWQPWLHR